MNQHVDIGMPMKQSAKSCEHALQAGLQQIVDAIESGICGLDAQGNATFCNDALLKMTGYRAAEVVGRNVHGLLHHSRPDRSVCPAEECEFPKAIANHQALHAADKFLWRKDGSSFPAEYWLRPLPQSSGSTLHVVTVKDTSDVHRAMEAVRRGKEMFRRILASAPDVAWTSDQLGQTVYISPKVESVLGYTNEEIYRGGNHLWLSKIHAADLERVHAAYKALFEKGSVYDQEYRIQRKDGSWIWIHDRASCTHTENGIAHADGFFCDVTARKQAEEELRSKTAFLEAQANATIDGLLVVDRQGRQLMCNQRLGELFSIPAELMADKDDENMLKYVVTLLKDPEGFLAKVRYLYSHENETSRDEIELKNGMFLDRYSSPVVDSKGVYYGRIWTFRDITERKKNEDELQQLSLAVEQSSVSVVITDPQGYISYVNPKFSECTGYSANEVVGKNPRILKSGLYTPDLYQGLWATIKAGKTWHGEFCNKKKNGEIYWEAASISPITNRNGVITHFLAVKEDITERRRAEKEFRLTQFSVEHASAAIQWMNSEGRIVYVNQATCLYLRRSREELLSLGMWDINPNFSKPTWNVFWEELKKQSSITYDSQLQTKDGEVFPVEISSNYLTFDGQEYCFGFARDIRERRQLESQLRHSQKLEGIGQLAAGIAHEINTPTQFVSDNLTFLRDSWNSIYGLLERYRHAVREAASRLPAGAADALEQAEQSCDLSFIASEVPRAIDQSLDGAHRVARIVRAMKEFSHPDSAEKTATNLNKAIESTVTVARNEWKYVAELVTEFDAALPPVVCYPGDINQVVLNLIVNAAHAIKEKIKDAEKGRITVRTRMLDGCVEVSVADTGTGIGEAIRGRVFDPFFTTKEVGKGTGQGLALACAVVVKKHGGKIWFKTKVGEGTTFFITLPTETADSSKEKS
jgi:PAS domain S-box-containing protein